MVGTTLALACAENEIDLISALTGLTFWLTVLSIISKLY
jgi:hypothetical protein